MEKLGIVLFWFTATFLGLAMLPYLLIRVWVHTIPLKKKARGLDLDLRG